MYTYQLVQEARPLQIHQGLQLLPLHLEMRIHLENLLHQRARVVPVLLDHP